MKLQLVATVLLAACVFAPSLAAPLQEGEAQAVLQAIRMLLASENHGWSEIQQTDDSTTNPPAASTPSGQPPNATSNGRCEVQEDSDKVNCGYVGIIQTQCEAKGCCWKEPSVSGVPFCFHKVELTPRCQANDRVNCGYFGIGEGECEDRGCCWSPSSADELPWCYHEKALGPQCQTDPLDRIECGYLGISAGRCKAFGCCWSPTSSTRRPWCFMKGAATR